MDQHTRHSVYDISHVPPSQLQLHLQHARPSQPPHNNVPVQDPAMTQKSMEESLKRSVTLVFWYKAGCDPLRLHQEIATFPLFQLSQFTHLVTDLGLTATTYVDAYNPVSSTWEQQTISAVRMIESEQRLLYRIRKGLLEGLADNDCPGVDHEIGLQPRLTKSVIVSVNASLKRPASNTDSYGPPTKYYRPEDYNGSHRAYDPPLAPEGGVYPQNLSVPKPSPQNEYYSQPSSQNAHNSPHVPPSAPISHQYPSSSPGLSASSSQSSFNGETAIPFHPHPPLKRWPNDYTVSEIASGFRRMDAMIAAQPTSTQKSTFQTVFGCRYIKSTVCRHRAVWKRADPGLKDMYERMGSDERAVWGEFVKKAEGKVSNGNGHSNQNGHGSQGSIDATPAPKPIPSHMQHPSQSAGMMSSMQGQVSPPTPVAMGMLAHGLPPHVNLGEPDKSEPPVMASLVPPSHVTGGNMHSGHVSASNHETSAYLQQHQSSPSNSQSQ